MLTAFCTHLGIHTTANSGLHRHIPRTAGVCKTTDGGFTCKHTTANTIARRLQFKIQNRKQPRQNHGKNTNADFLEPQLVFLAIFFTKPHHTYMPRDSQRVEQAPSRHSPATYNLIFKPLHRPPQPRRGTADARQKNASDSRLYSCRILTTARRPRPHLRHSTGTKSAARDRRRHNSQSEFWNNGPQCHASAPATLAARPVARLIRPETTQPEIAANQTRWIAARKYCILERLTLTLHFLHLSPVAPPHSGRPNGRRQAGA